MTVQITTKKELKNWLKGKPVEVSRVIAHRAAARVLPLLAVNIKRAGFDAEWQGELTKVTFRCIIAAYFAPSAQRTAARRAAADAWAALNKDLNEWEKWGNIEALLTSPLWHGHQPDESEQHWDVMQDKLPDNDKNWKFWIDFYNRLLRGSAYDADYVALMVDIAQIDDDIWKKPAAVVNKIVAGKYENYERQLEERKTTQSFGNSGSAFPVYTLKMLIQAPLHAAANADFLATQIKLAADDIRESNETEGVEIFDALESRFKEISKLFKGYEEKLKAVEDKAALQENTIKELKEEIAQLKADLEKMVKLAFENSTPAEQGVVRQGMQTFVNAFCKTLGVATASSFTLATLAVFSVNHALLQIINDMYNFTAQKTGGKS